MLLQELQIAHFDFVPLTTDDLPKVQHRAGHMSKHTGDKQNSPPSDENTKAAVWISHLFRELFHLNNL